MCLLQCFVRSESISCVCYSVSSGASRLSCEGGKNQQKTHTHTQIHKHRETHTHTHTHTQETFICSIDSLCKFPRKCVRLKT